ncbi:radical SAM protein [Methylocaldum szegediense]|uniref:Wyosine [tRNA(Phe)-imidazoG37] synthetase (Radical SAM superfamily) n=1 Tax=Methylocaldum szegediense TaxID=73780 RepID=A0ABM9I8B9_9GAMM|nr:radical SAM protein [Methylocaldum szegediense]CAI8955782.1 Wyosine [tRNA(Phe)-imidazoG37] synthetase (Radical SAM superfamily) [Methylocaldum szegediense]
MRPLTTKDHSRDSAGLTYVYPVISRRSGGLSVGINLNPNNACNWRCVYCQVPNLTRGAAPDIDAERLGGELRALLNQILTGDFYHRFQIPPEQRAIKDIAISGNGEPTSCKTLDRIVELIGTVCDEFGLLGQIKLVLITNGSLVHKPIVQAALKRWSELGGEVWFKVDSATVEGILRINQVNLTPGSVHRNLEICARLCPTWIQTCLFSFDGESPSEAERRAYLDFLADLKHRDVPIQGVLLYGLARPSMQEQAPRLSALPGEELDAIADRIRALGFSVKVTR